ncbi:MAG: hypothetical protein Q7R97_03775 [Candidatus Daviesbacteria bacterium]|nr:hypothetical protein [Candidatus Daviesbacteria bacterium]
MINHIWSVLCQKSSVDQQSNNVSLFDVFEALEVGINPDTNIKISDNPEFNIPVQYQVVSLWTCTDNKKSEGQIRITLVNPEGKERILVNSDLKFLIGKKRMRSINQIQGLPVNISGDYHFIVELKQEEKFQKVADLPLEVKLNINSAPKQA